ncbi:hypothetical protein THAOC_25778, partial [Thalassiosira oceanica]
LYLGVRVAMGALDAMDALDALDWRCPRLACHHPRHLGVAVGGRGDAGCLRWGDHRVLHHTGTGLVGTRSEDQGGVRDPTYWVLKDERRPGGAGRSRGASVAGCFSTSFRAPREPSNGRHIVLGDFASAFPRPGSRGHRGRAGGSGPLGGEEEACLELNR